MTNLPCSRTSLITMLQLCVAKSGPREMSRNGGSKVEGSPLIHALSFCFIHRKFKRSNSTERTQKWVRDWQKMSVKCHQMCILFSTSAYTPPITTEQEANISSFPDFFSSFFLLQPLSLT